MAVFHDKLDTTGNIITATITLAALASSATVGRQSSEITLIDGSQRVPPMLDIEFTAAVGAGTLAVDKAAYLWAARSSDESVYEVGPPVVGVSDAGFTFTNSPVGTSPLPTDLFLLGALTFNAASETRRRIFRLFNPPAKLVLVVLNYSGIALASGSVKLRKRWPESV